MPVHEIPQGSGTSQGSWPQFRILGSLEVESASGLIHTDRSGYRAAIDRQALDAVVFEAMVMRAEVVAGLGKTAEAAELLRSALGLWRGPFLDGLRSSATSAAALAWQEKRYAATETFHDYQLALGRHREIIAELQLLTAEQPWRERPAAQLMLALYRSGRQVDALTVYATFRKRMASELGLDPGEELRTLHERILAADPAIARPLGQPSKDQWTPA